MKKIGKIIENVVMVFAIIIVLFFGAMILLPQFDYGLIVIKSGSMEPTIKTGGAVIIKTQNTYGADDVITFAKGRELVTHRIVAIADEDGETIYTTKGDNNNATDIAPVSKSDVRGKVIFTLPYIGYVIAFFQSRVGIMLLILIPTVYFIGREVIKIKQELNRKKEMDE